MITYGDKKGTLYRGDYRPAEIYTSRPSLNLFDINTMLKDSFVIEDENVISNKVKDGRNFIQFTVQVMRDNTYLGEASFKNFYVNDRINAIARINSSVHPTGNVLRFKHNGSTQDLRIVDFKADPDTDYYFDAEILSSDPSVIGGFKLKNVQIRYSRIESPYEYEAYGEKYPTKVAGFITESHSGLDVDFEETYNDHADVVLNGSHYQKQYKGKNLFDPSGLRNDMHLSPAPIGTPVEFKGRVAGIIPVKVSNVRYLMVTYNQNPDLATVQFIWACFKDGAFLNRTNGGRSGRAVYLNDGTTEVYLAWYHGSGNMTADDISNIQVEIGETATDYEPFVGGEPSPNPYFPQEIIGISNPIISVDTRNLLNPSLDPDPINGLTPYPSYLTLNRDGSISFTAIGASVPIGNYNGSTGAPLSKSGGSFHLVPCKQGETFTFSVVYTPNATNGYSVISEIAEDGDTVVAYKAFQGVKEYTYTITHPDAKYVTARFSMQNLEIGTEYNVKVQIEKGEVNHEYHPYKEPIQKQLPFSLYGITMNGEKVCDKIEPCVKIGDEWKCRVIRRWKRIVFDGQSQWEVTGWSKASYSPYNTFYIGMNGVMGTSIQVGSIMSHFKPFSLPAEIGKKNGCYVSYTWALYITIEDDSIDTAEKFRAWLKSESDKGTPVYGIFRTITADVPLSTEYYDPIIIPTFPQYTHISMLQDNPNLSPTMEVSAKVIDHSVAELTSMLDAQYLDAIGELS